MRRLFAAAFAAALPLAAAAEGEPALDMSAFDGIHPTVAVSFASAHIGAERDFEEFNPGVSIGLSGDGPLRSEWGVEGGYFRNSYGEGSAYFGVWADWRVVQFTSGIEGRLGVFFAYAEYPQLVDEAEDFGALTIGDFVPLVAAQAAIRLDERLSLVARFGPGISDSDVILGFQAMYRF